jgi:hypothetical protein
MECVTKEPEEDTPVRESCKTCVAHHDLSFSQINRYSRQILTQVGIDGGSRLFTCAVHPSTLSLPFFSDKTNFRGVVYQKSSVLRLTRDPAVRPILKLNNCF